MSRRILCAALALLAVGLAPSASACSWSTPEVGALTWTESGLFFMKRETLVRGDERGHETIAHMGPFSSYLAAPNGTVAYLSRGLGSVGADCRMEGRALERWTPAGVEDLTAFLPTLPLDVHWASGRGILHNGTNATVIDLSTGDVLATLRPAQESGKASYRGYAPQYIHNARWAPSGDKIALHTDDEIWLFRPDGSYIYDEFPSFPARSSNALIAFSPEGDRLAVAWSSGGDRLVELRILDFTQELAKLYAAGHVDVRSAQAMAFGPNGTLAVAFQQAPLFSGDKQEPNASVTVFDRDLDPIANVSWPGEWMGRSLSWSPQGDELAVIVDERIVRVPIGARLPPTPGEDIPADPRPIPGGGALGLLAILSAMLAMRAWNRRRRATHL